MELQQDEISIDFDFEQKSSVNGVPGNGLLVLLNNTKQYLPASTCANW